MLKYECRRTDRRIWVERGLCGDSTVKRCHRSGRPDLIHLPRRSSCAGHIEQLAYAAYAANTTICSRQRCGGSKSS